MWKENVVGVAGERHVGVNSQCGAQMVCATAPQHQHTLFSRPASHAKRGRRARKKRGGKGLGEGAGTLHRIKCQEGERERNSWLPTGTTGTAAKQNSGIVHSADWDGLLQLQLFGWKKCDWTVLPVTGRLGSTSCSAWVRGGQAKKKANGAQLPCKASKRGSD